MSRVGEHLRGWGAALAALGACVLVIVIGWRVMTKSRGESDDPRRVAMEDLRLVIESAEILRLQGEATKSEMVLREAVTRYGELQDVHVALAELLIDKSSALMDEEESAPVLNEAYACYARAVEIGPKAADLEFVAGTVASKLGRWDRALMHYSVAQSMEPREPRYALFLAQVQLRENQFEAAKKHLKTASDLDPESATAWGTLAEVALREGDVQVAMEYVSRARAIEPANPVWRVIEARALLRSDQPRQAIDVLVGLDESRKQEIGVLSVLVEGYERLGMFEEAATLYDKAAGAHPSNGEIALGAARRLQRVGRTADAKKHAERAKLLGVDGAMELIRTIDGR